MWLSRSIGKRSNFPTNISRDFNITPPGFQHSQTYVICCFNKEIAFILEKKKYKSAMIRSRIYVFVQISWTNMARETDLDANQRYKAEDNS